MVLTNQKHELKQEVIKEITKDWTISDILTTYHDQSAKLIDIMMKHGLHCFGCGASTFETVEQGTLGHGMPTQVMNQLILELNEVIRAGNPNSTTLREPQTQQVQASPSNPVLLTSSAVSKIKELMKKTQKEDYGLRVGIVPGGCAGFSYKIEFEKSAGKEDITFEQDGIRVFMDDLSVDMLSGSQVDYIETLQQSGFKIENPKAHASCHCGSSFR